MVRRAKGKAHGPLVVCDSDHCMFVYLSREVIAERETLRRLAHRVVDLAVDCGQQEWLGGQAAYRLSCIARDHVIKMVTDLVHEVLPDDS